MHILGWFDATFRPLTGAFSGVHSVVDMCARATRDDKCLVSRVSRTLEAPEAWIHYDIRFLILLEPIVLGSRLGADVRDLR